MIDAMLVHIPPREALLIRRLENIKTKLSFTAPEAMGARWVETEDLLDASTRGRSDPWMAEASRIWRGVG